MERRNVFTEVKYRRFVYVIVFTAIIYLTLPFARLISEYLRTHNLLKHSIYILIAVFIVICCYLIFRYIGYKLINIITILLFFTIYVLIIQRYDIIVEKLHFVEYGILSYLIYNSLTEQLSSRLIYPVSFIILTIIGWVDEIIQYYLPDRFYDIRDVCLNSLSGCLILILIYIVEKLRDRSFDIGRN
ncbi:MAG: VanZ family protein [Spirochaetota bacterium]|nr:VanZ family protein [Spirochaetota bacterium]